MEYNEVYNYFFKRIESMRCIVPLYRFNIQKGFPEFMGSSVYCDFGPIHMLITARHVLEHFIEERPLYPYASNETREVPCVGINYHEDNSLDMGAILLENHLPNFSSLDFSTFDRFEQNNANQHLLVGFPATRTKKSTRSKQKLSLLGYLTSGVPNTCKKNYIINDDLEFAVGFTKEHVFAENLNEYTFPHPHGMSGGAVFQFKEDNPSCLSLVGIMKEWKKLDNTIIATRIESYSRIFNIVQLDINKIKSL